LYYSLDVNISLIDLVDNKKMLTKGDVVEAQIRYRGEVKNVTILDINHLQKTATIEFEKTDATLAAGQSVVFYKGNECLGGGIIT